MDSKDEANKREDEIIDIIREIVKKSSDGEHIYRGQSGTYYPQSDDDDTPPQPDDDDTFPQVTSTLYRALYRELEKRRPKKGGDELREWCEWFGMEHDMNLVQEEALESARKFTSEDCGDEEILSRIQHYSGHTNLIDFTKDYLVALFFASYHKYGIKDGENGKVFLLKIAKLKDREIKTITPVHPNNRVTAQKSVFVQSRSGVILIKGLMEVVNIPLRLKQPILDYLKEHHDISLSTIYNDLHGYVRNNKEHGNAIMEFYLGVNYNNKISNAQSPKEKSDAAEKAMRHFDKAILLDPKYVRAYNALGVAKRNRGDAKKELGDISGAKSDYEDAISNHEDAIALDPEDMKAYGNRGIAKWKLGNFLDAISDYDKAIALDPKHVYAYNGRGHVKLDCGHVKKDLGDMLGAISDYKDAISDYDKAIALDPGDVHAYNNRGRAKWNYGDAKQRLDDVSVAISDYKDAINDCDKAIALDSGYVHAYNNRGLAKQGCGNAKQKLGNVSDAIVDYKDAISDYDKVIALDSRYVHVYNNRGIANLKLGDISDAISDYDKAIALDSKYLYAYYNRGNANLKLGDNESAVKDFSVVLDLNPSFAPAYLNRGRAFENLQNFQQAFSDFENAEKLTLQQNNQDIVKFVQEAIKRVKEKMSKL